MVVVGVQIAFGDSRLSPVFRPTGKTVELGEIHLKGERAACINMHTTTYHHYLVTVVEMYTW